MASFEDSYIVIAGQLFEISTIEGQEITSTDLEGTSPEIFVKGIREQFDAEATLSAAAGRIRTVLTDQEAEAGVSAFAEVAIQAVPLALDAEAFVAATAGATYSRGTTIGATAILNGTPVRLRLTSTGLAATASLTPDAGRIRFIGSDQDGAATVSPTAVQDAVATTTQEAEADVDPDAGVTYAVDSSQVGSGVVFVTAGVIRAAITTQAGTSTLTADNVRVRAGDTSLSGTGTQTVDPTLTAGGASNLVASATLSGGPSVTNGAVVALDAEAIIAAAAGRTAASEAALDTNAALVAAATRIFQTSTSQTAVATTSISATRVREILATLAATGSVSPDPSLTAGGSTTLGTTSTLSSTAQQEFGGSTTLAGSANLVPLVERIRKAATSLATSGDLAAAAARVLNGTTSISAVASSTHDAIRIAGGSTSQDGAGSLVADALLIVAKPLEFYLAWQDTSNDDLAFTSATGSTTAWQTAEDVDTTDFTGGEPSIAFDSNRDPHIVYRDNTEDILKYAVHDGSSWTIESIPSTSSSSGKIGLLSDDTPVVVYYNFSSDVLYYTERSGSTWSSAETIDTSVEVVKGRVLQIDSNDDVHVVYNSSFSFVYYATGSGSTWTTELVDNPIDARRFGLELDSNEVPHVVYLDSGEGSFNDLHDVRYANRVGGSWSAELVYSGSDFPRPDLALDSNDDPLVAYEEGDDIYYTDKTSGTWSTPSQVSTDNFAIDAPEIIVDAFDTTHIAYPLVSSDALRIATWNGSSWDIETAATDDSPRDVTFAVFSEPYGADMQAAASLTSQPTLVAGGSTSLVADAFVAPSVTGTFGIASNQVGAGSLASQPTLVAGGSTSLVADALVAPAVTGTFGITTNQVGAGSLASQPTKVSGGSTALVADAFVAPSVTGTFGIASNQVGSATLTPAASGTFGLTTSLLASMQATLAPTRVRTNSTSQSSSSTLTAAGTVGGGTSLPTGIYAHYDAGSDYMQANYSTGDSVTDWPDDSGNSYDITSVTGTAVYRNDATGYYIEGETGNSSSNTTFSNSMPSFDSGSTGVTAFFVGQIREPAYREVDPYLESFKVGNGEVVEHAGVEGNRSSDQEGSATDLYGRADDVDGGYLFNAVHYVTIYVESDIETCDIDGVEELTSTGTVTGKTIGGDLEFYSEDPSSGENRIYEFILYDKNLTATERADVETYLTDKYSL